MKSELSFLLELILDEQTPQLIKTKLVKRVQEVEKNYSSLPQQTVPRGTKATLPVLSVQAPSMQRVMQDNPDLIPKPPVAVTASAASALAHRQALINGAVNGDNDKDRKSARKF